MRGRYKSHRHSSHNSQNIILFFFHSIYWSIYFQIVTITRVYKFNMKKQRLTCIYYTYFKYNLKHTSNLYVVEYFNIILLTNLYVPKCNGKSEPHFFRDIVLIKYKVPSIVSVWLKFIILWYKLLFWYISKSVKLKDEYLSVECNIFILILFV